MKKILIIEDDESLLKAYRQMFKPEEIRIIGITSGQKGLALAKTEKPDLILLDIMLPGGINGFDVLEKLKADPFTKQIPVIILTNLDSEEKVAKSIGARNYLIKSDTSKDEIVKLITNCLKYPNSESKMSTPGVD